MANLNKGKNSSNYSHGMTRTPEYRTWKTIIQRCTNQNNTHYKDYGGRGITVCDRWRNFINFYTDMGCRPEGKTIDRINNNGNYEKSNCRWATRAEQSQNQRMKKNNKTGVTGVSWNKQHQKYEIRKMIYDKRIFLGYFTNFTEATSALKTFDEERM